MIAQHTNSTFKLAIIWRWIVISLLSVLLLLSCAAIYLSYHYKPIVTRKIKKAISTTTDGLYSINFDDISINLLTGNVGFKNIVFKPDTAVFNEMRSKGIAPKHIYQVKLDGLFLQRIHPGKIYFKKELNMSSIIIDRPSITVTYNDFRTKEDTTEDKRTAYERLSSVLKSVKIQDIVFEHVNFKYVDKSLAKPLTTGFKNMLIKVTDLQIDSAASRDKTRFYYTKDVFVDLMDHQMITKDGMYTLKLGELTSSTSGGYLRLKNFRYLPNYPEMAFTRKYPVQKERYDMRVDDIILHGIDFKKLNTDRKLVASSLLIDKAKINIFLNREKPAKQSNRLEKFPQILLSKLKLNSFIDTLLIKNSTVNYAEYNPETLQRGLLTFNQLSATLKNVTNDSASLAKNHWCNSSATAMLMGKSKINLNINFNLTSPVAAYTYSGSIGWTDLRILNHLSKSLSKLELKSGIVKKATFDVKADGYKALGTLKVYYNDFAIGIMKMDDKNQTLKKRGLISLLANALIIKNNNPEPGKVLRIGKIDFKRPITSTFFNMLWNSVFSGLKSSIGISNKLQENLAAKAVEMGKEKTKREIRRTERKKKREERRKKREEKKQANR